MRTARNGRFPAVRGYYSPSFPGVASTFHFIPKAQEKTDEFHLLVLSIRARAFLKLNPASLHFCPTPTEKPEHFSINTPIIDGYASSPVIFSVLSRQSRSGEKEKAGGSSPPASRPFAAPFPSRSPGHEAVASPRPRSKSPDYLLNGQLHFCCLSCLPCSEDRLAMLFSGMPVSFSIISKYRIANSAPGPFRRHWQISFHTLSGSAF